MKSIPGLFKGIGWGEKYKTILARSAATSNNWIAFGIFFCQMILKNRMSESIRFISKAIVID